MQIDIDYQKWKTVLDGEVAEWNEEVELMSAFKHYFNDLLKKINYGIIEEEIIEAERNIDLQ